MKLSAGVAVFREPKTRPIFLLLRAYRNWDFPKGEVESGEEPFIAAIREVREETGIRDLTFPFGRVFFEVGPYGKGKIARYYLGKTQQETIVLPINPQLGKPEHHEWRWVTLAEAETLVPERLLPLLDWIAHIAQEKSA